MINRNEFAPFTPDDPSSSDLKAEAEEMYLNQQEEKRMEAKMEERKAERAFIGVQEAQEITIFKADKALDRVDEVIKFIEGLRKRLKEGEDYNQHPGYMKPALEKPGAEKICVALNCGPEVIKKDATIINQQYGLKEYELIVGLRHRITGKVVGEGIGYGRADEKDLYTWDKEQNKKILKPERAEWANNTALKMAYKSALICAGLSTAALSGYFTQDLEEIKNDKITQPKSKQPQGDLTDVMPIGKYKGLSLEEIYKKDKQYLGWAAHKLDNASLKDKIALFLDSKRLPNDKLKGGDLEEEIIETEDI